MINIYLEYQGLGMIQDIVVPRDATFVAPIKIQKPDRPQLWLWMIHQLKRVTSMSHFIQ